MKSLKEYLKESFAKKNKGQQEILFEMANLSQKVTDLNVVVWVQVNINGATGKHNLPRIKVQTNTSGRVNVSEMVPFSISDNPQILLKQDKLRKVKLTTEQIKNIRLWIIKNNNKFDLLKCSILF